MKELIYEKIRNHPFFHTKLFNYLNIHHIDFNFRVKNNNEGVLLLILNLCLLEKLLGSNFTFIIQKKNIRKFSPINSVIGCRFFLKKNVNFIRDFLFFWSSHKNLIFVKKKKKKLNKFEKFNHFIFLNFSLSDFIYFSYLKLGKSNWETFSYLYEKYIYGLDVSLFVDTRYYLFIKLLLSMEGIILIETNG